MTDALPLQRQRIWDARTLLEDVVQRKVTAFRAPRFVVSSNTFLALESAGFEVDLSVCPQRLPFLSSQPGNLAWLTCPRSPYHPSYQSPFRRGDMRLWEVPTTSFLLPFTSLIYQSLGLRTARLMTRMFAAEARRCSRPVVFLCHPEEFVESSVMRPPAPKTLRAFVPRRDGGMAVRFWLYERDESVIFRSHMAMMQVIKNVAGAEFLTVDQYLERLSVGTNHPKGQGDRQPSE